jgi:hypothetical protein
MDWSSIKIIFPLPKKLTRHAIGGKDVFSLDTFDIEYLIREKWCILFFLLQYKYYFALRNTKN